MAVTLQLRRGLNANLAAASAADGEPLWVTDTHTLWVSQGGTKYQIGAGTVTSVGLSLPAVFSVTGSPVTGSGTLTATLATQSANAVFAGPTTGAAAAPTFRALVSADIGANIVAIASLAQVAATAVLANATSAAANVAALQATADGQLLVRRSGALTFGTLVSGDIPALSYLSTGLMTTLGDLIYENATPAAARLPGNTSATKKYLTQTGTGSASAAPAWGTIAAADVPVMVAAGGSHAAGLVPDPGSTAHSPAYALGDDAAYHKLLGTKGDLLATDGTNLNQLAVGNNGSPLVADSTQTNGFSWQALPMSGQVQSARLHDNYLVNGGHDFADYLATPGTLTTITSGKYAANRWRNEQQSAGWQYQRAANPGTIQANNYGSWKNNSGASSKFMTYQILKASETGILAARSAVIAQCKLWLSSGTATILLGLMKWTGTADAPSNPVVSAWNANTANPTLTTNWAFLGSPTSCPVSTTPTTFNFSTASIGSTTTNLAVVIYTDSQLANGAVLNMTEAGLYDGGAPRDWLPRSQDEEFRRCQHFLHTVGGQTSQYLGSGLALSGTSTVLVVPHPVALRVSPTLTYSALADWTVYNGVITPTAIGLNSFGPNLSSVAVTVAAGLTAGQATIMLANSTSARIWFDAEFN